MNTITNTITSGAPEPRSGTRPSPRTTPPAPAHPGGRRATSTGAAVPEAEPAAGVTATAAELIAGLRPLLAAEAAAEARAAGAEPADLEQAVWLRLLERLHAAGPPHDPAGWLRRAVRAEARRWRRTARREGRYAPEPADDAWRGPEPQVLAALRSRNLRAAVRRLPGRCPRLVTALLSPQDPTYREIAGELGISQGSLGPERSRCLGCLRRMLTAEVVVPGPRGKH